MSSELKMIINKVALEESERKEIDLEKEIDRYNTILQTLIADKKVDVLFSVEGAEMRDSKIKDYAVLEKAGLVKGETKYTHRNEYRRYELTPKGAELAEKLSKEN